MIWTQDFTGYNRKLNLVFSPLHFTCYHPILSWMLYGVLLPLPIGFLTSTATYMTGEYACGLRAFLDIWWISNWVMVSDTPVHLSASVNSSTSTWLSSHLGLGGRVLCQNHFMNHVGNIKSSLPSLSEESLVVITAGHCFLQAWHEVFALLEFHVQTTLKSESLIVLVAWDFNCAYD